MKCCLPQFSFYQEIELISNLFVLIDALHSSQQQWSCRDVASILWDFYPTLGCHDIEMCFINITTQLHVLYSQ